MSGRAVIVGRDESECDMLGKATREGGGESGVREEVEGVEGEAVDGSYIREKGGQTNRHPRS